MARQRSHWIAQLSVGCLAILSALGLSGRFAMTGHARAGVAAILDDGAPLRVDVLRAAGGTYIAQVLAERDSTLSRWPSRLTNPIRVWIEPSSMLGFDERVRAAFGEWIDAGLPLRFAFVERARDAEIRVRWTDRLD